MLIIDLLAEYKKRNKKTKSEQNGDVISDIFKYRSFLSKTHLIYEPSKFCELVFEFSAYNIRSKGLASP